MAYDDERAGEIRELFEAAQQLDRELIERVLAVAQERQLDPAHLLRLAGQKLSAPWLGAAGAAGARRLIWALGRERAIPPAP